MLVSSPCRGTPPTAARAEESEKAGAGWDVGANAPISCLATGVGGLQHADGAIVRMFAFDELR